MYVGNGASEVPRSSEQNGDIGAVGEAVWSWNEGADKTLGSVTRLGPDANCESACHSAVDAVAASRQRVGIRIWRMMLPW